MPTLAAALHESIRLYPGTTGHTFRRTTHDLKTQRSYLARASIADDVLGSDFCSICSGYVRRPGQDPRVA